jgi:6-phosphogluconate dehydrogenase
VIKMQIGMVGLGRMGGNMARRLLAGGHEVVGYARSAATVQELVDDGGRGADSLSRVVAQLAPPRAVWMMVPAGAVVDQTIDALLPELAAGDVLIDGGNSNFKDTMQRAARIADAHCHYVDAGTSGGVWGLKEGYSLMVGGEDAVIARLRPLFETLAPAADRGWGHVGPVGSGHFVKMVHNGIEYGMMQAFAEGFSILKHKQEFELDLAQIAELWRYGSVVRSWLLDLTASALGESPDLSDIAPWVSDSGEGRWTVQEAIDLDVPAPVITLALIQRLRSRDEESFADRLLAAMRNQFGGHALKHEPVA